MHRQQALDRRLNVAELFAVYGPLLTDHQRRLIELYHDQDLSLGEISEDTGVSRQAVHDTLVRAEAALEVAEARLGILKWRKRLIELVTELARELEVSWLEPTVREKLDQLQAELLGPRTDDHV